MLGVARSGAGRVTVHLGHCRKGAGGGIGKAAGVVGGAENRVVRDQRRFVRGVEHRAIRSEEHTSELQSLMRISYAVFCLKKKNNKKQNQQITQHSIISQEMTNR